MPVSFASLPDCGIGATSFICISATELNRRGHEFTCVRRVLLTSSGCILARERTETRDNLSGKLSSRPKPLLLNVNDRMGGERGANKSACHARCETMNFEDGMTLSLVSQFRGDN